MEQVENDIRVVILGQGFAFYAKNNFIYPLTIFYLDVNYRILYQYE